MLKDYSLLGLNFIRFFCCNWGMQFWQSCWKNFSQTPKYFARWTKFSVFFSKQLLGKFFSTGTMNFRQVFWSFAASRLEHFWSTTEKEKITFSISKCSSWHTKCSSHNLADKKEKNRNLFRSMSKRWNAFFQKKYFLQKVPMDAFNANKTTPAKEKNYTKNLSINAQCPKMMKKFLSNKKVFAQNVPPAT